MKNTNSITEDVWLVYDGECPVCNTYCKYIRIRDAVGSCVWSTHATPAICWMRLPKLDWT